MRCSITVSSYQTAATPQRGPRSKQKGRSQAPASVSQPAAYISSSSSSSLSSSIGRDWAMKPVSLVDSSSSQSDDSSSSSPSSLYSSAVSASYRTSLPLMYGRMPGSDRERKER